MSKRTDQVAGLIRSEISEIIKSRMKDPRIGFVTILEVKLTSDLRHAKVFFSVLGDAAKTEDSIKTLIHATAFIQNELGARIRLKYTPSLQFIPDKSIDYGANIETLLNQIEYHSTDDV